MPMRDTLHRLVDERPESELASAECFLNYLRVTADPVLRALLEAPVGRRARDGGRAPCHASGA